MAAAAGALTVALLLRRGSTVSAAIAIVAVPLIAYRTMPRADIFTVVLFAALISLLWENFSNQSCPAVVAAAADGCLGQFASRLCSRAGADGCLRGNGRAGDVVRRNSPRHGSAEVEARASWFAASVFATLLNPWGSDYLPGVVSPGRAMAQHLAMAQ